MKKRILLSFILGIILILVSLLHKTGQLEPMPYVNNPPGIVNGIVAFPSEEYPAALAKRGFPLPVVSIDNDEDSPGNYYKSIIAGNLALDYAIFVVTSFGLLSLVHFITVKKKLVSAK